MVLELDDLLRLEQMLEHLGYFCGIRVSVEHHFEIRFENPAAVDFEVIHDLCRHRRQLIATNALEYFNEIDFHHIQLRERKFQVIDGQYQIEGLG